MSVIAARAVFPRGRPGIAPGSLRAPVCGGVVAGGQGTGGRKGGRARALFIAALIWLGLARSQAVQHLSVTQPGGMPGLPVMTGITKGSNAMQLTWEGPPAYYQIHQKSNHLTAPWEALGKATNYQGSVRVAALYPDAFFRVSCAAPQYAGAKVCVSCHLKVCRYETNTPHAMAFLSPAFKGAGGQTNSSCLPCHTVGYGLPSGFSLTNRGGFFSYTTNLAGVQCENCHGPAGNHAANETDPVVRPRVVIAAQVCGGCHTGARQPTYEEWSSSGHAAVVPEAAAVMAANPDNISTCGRCHSGTARLALIAGQNPAVTLKDDYNVPITCVVCHDPHQTNSVPGQLRNPVYSTNAFHLAAADSFAAKYNANINLCAQCHNDRGESWRSAATNEVVLRINSVVYTNRIVVTNYLDDHAPHGSAQYNFMLGSVGELAGGPADFNPGTHAGLPSSAGNSLSGAFYLTNQCVSCHMQQDPESAQALHSHKLGMSNYGVCLKCHNFQPELLVQYVMVPAVSNRVYNLKYALDLWGDTTAAERLRAPGIVPWEYITPGGLVWQTNSSGGIAGWTQARGVRFSGPAAAGQSIIPDNIKKARFNLYLVLNDSSHGVHNPYFALRLLDTAYDWVLQELGY